MKCLERPETCLPSTQPQQEGEDSSNKLREARRRNHHVHTTFGGSPRVVHDHKHLASGEGHAHDAQRELVTVIHAVMVKETLLYCSHQ